MRWYGSHCHYTENKKKCIVETVSRCGDKSQCWHNRPADSDICEMHQAVQARGKKLRIPEDV